MHKSTLFAAALALLAPAAFADRDDHDHDRGRGHGHGYGHQKHKEEFWDGNCLVKREWKHGGYKEERKCKGHEQPREVVRVVPVQPVQTVVVYPPWIVRQQGEYAYHPQYRPVRAAPAAVRCNSEAVGRVLGGIVGGALGNQIGNGNGRTVATIGGAVTGVLVGGEIGKRIDSKKQACVGEVLEVAPVGRRVQWVDSKVTYVVVPGQVTLRDGAHCRPYTMDMQTPTGWQRTEGVACRRPGGVWVAA